jgi:hypothetical protein
LPWRVAFKFIEPATVPVNSSTGDEKTAAVPLAGMVNETVLDPFENITIGSSAAATALGVNEIDRLPDNGAG